MWPSLRLADGLAAGWLLVNRNYSDEINRISSPVQHTRSKKLNRFLHRHQANENNLAPSRRLSREAQTKLTINKAYPHGEIASVLKNSLPENHLWNSSPVWHALPSRRSRTFFGGFGGCEGCFRFILLRNAPGNKLLFQHTRLALPLC